MFPPIPAWEGLHPLVVHFPIALLMVAPLFVIAGLFVRKDGHWFQICALSLMVLGTIGAFVAVSTGEAAAELVMETAAIEPVLERHEELAETTQVVFAILTGIYALLVIVPLVLRRPLGQRYAIPASVIFLLLYSAGLLLLANTAHQGALLVHRHGVRAAITALPAPPGLMPPVAEGSPRAPDAEGGVA